MRIIILYIYIIIYIYNFIVCFPFLLLLKLTLFLNRKWLKTRHWDQGCSLTIKLNMIYFKTKIVDLVAALKQRKLTNLKYFFNQIFIVSVRSKESELLVYSETNFTVQQWTSVNTEHTDIRTTNYKYWWAKLMWLHWWLQVLR